MGRRENFLIDACKKLASLGVEAASFAGDVRKPEDAQKAVATAKGKFGRLNVLVNAAAGNFLALPEELSVNGFRTVMEIDALGVFNMCRHSFQALKEAGGGVIINISATLHYTATWFQAHACAAKAAIDSLTKEMALEWGEFGIRVNGIAPGPIADTPGLTKLLAAESDSEAALKQVIRTIPMRRVGTTADIGFTSVFLCTDAGSFISGDTIIVDGGEWLWKPLPTPRANISTASRNVEAKSRSMKGKL